MIRKTFAFIPFLYIYLMVCTFLVQPIYRDFKGIHLTQHDDRYHTVNAVGIYSVPSLLGCFQICLLENRCLSLFHNIWTGECILHFDPFTYTKMSQNGTGWKFYITKPVFGRCSELVNFFYYRYFDMCYNFNALVPTNYTAIEENCRTINTSLLRIDSAERMKYLQTITANIGTFGSGGICIQGYRGNVGDNWTFNDGTVMTYFNWGPSEPSAKSHIKVLRLNNYQWAASKNVGGSCTYSCEHF